MTINPPTEDDIKLAIAQLYAQVGVEYPDKLLSALVPVDKTFLKGRAMINYVVDWEMQEICDFVNGFNTHIQQTEDRFQIVRLKTLIYCHIMEADLPLTILWNLLRILNGDSCDWTFHRITKNGNRHVCQYPREKIIELKRLSDETGLDIGEVVERLWEPGLRNTFSHSQYCWMGDRLQPTKSLSPISRKDGGANNVQAFTFDEIDTLYRRADNLLYYFTVGYRSVIANYKDGNAYRIQDGWIVWDKQSGWVWEENARVAT